MERLAQPQEVVCNLFKLLAKTEIIFPQSHLHIHLCFQSFSAVAL
jgi:hypothetical protein